MRRRSAPAPISWIGSSAAAADIEILTDATVTALYADPDGRVRGVEIARPDGSGENIGCGALVLACSGYGGDAVLVRRHIPELGDALYFGHAGNRGDALRWGEELGGVGRDLGAYQGHGSVAHPHGILITWALMMEGGFQVSRDGLRFSHENRGYSEQAVDVLRQPGGVAINIYDERLHKLGLDFEDYRGAVDAGAVKSAPDIAGLAARFGIPPEALAQSLVETREMAAGTHADPFGRDFTKKPALAPPFYGVQVTGALFHTQGGLEIDTEARVLRRDCTPLPNLLAGGGAARGLSGPERDGYFSGGGLLTAVTLGRIAGETAARIAASV